MNTKPLTTPPLTADAVGFISRRKDRPERLALFHANGALSSTFGMDETMDDLRAALAKAGMSVDAEGIVRRVG
jgi:hypothetical protein